MMERWSPIAEFERLWNEMDRLMSETFARTARPILTRAFTVRPAIDLFDTGEALVVKVAVPGAKPEDLEVSIEQNALTIRGRYGYVLDEETAKHATWYRREIGYGEFSETLSLPVPVDADAAQASVEHGILTLTLPKTTEARVKRIPVQEPKALASSAS
ncbi:MAG: Hsp20/alpha crystallin family protein [Thermomicrobium sp.]|nr:Hsp20/alpha crystallin family protein [Thermomicrobium sp.]MDW8060251.1 Hsp20/alpha crystallin family protein [Thermomicrobium sp.]